MFASRTESVAIRNTMRVRPLAAVKALAGLLKNPQDTQQVFLLTEALRGRSSVAPFLRFCGSPAGAAIIAERRSLLAALSGKEALRAMPEDSLGRRYLAFMAAENLSAHGLVEVGGGIVRTLVSPDEAIKLYASRMRDMHDLYHVLAGYGRDELGEVCVLAFSYPQQRIRSFAVIALFGALHVRRLRRRAGHSPKA